tara:strand:+ start:286 stop:993 length:708 start_codon:yes stop_codon:yes gene_type:complete
MIDVCVICAREGSKEVKNKNIKKILGKTLISWSIRQAINSKLFYKVYVSTDSKKIAKISKKSGAEVPFLRSPKLSDDQVSKFFVWKNALKKIEQITKKKIRYYVDLDCTNPIRTKKDIVGVINLLKKNKKADGIVTICKSRKNPYFNMVEKSKNNFIKISKKIKNNIFSRQQAPKVFDIVANIYCLKAEYLKKSNHLLKGNILGYELEQHKSFDIDTKYDLEIVKMFLKRFVKNV